MDNTSMGASPACSARSALAGLSLRIQDVLDTLPAGGLVVDASGVILAANAEVARQFGYEQGELLLNSVDMLVPAGLRDGHAKLRHRAIGSDQMRVMGPGRSLQGQCKDGSIFPIEVGLRSLRSGDTQFILAVVSDRSEQLRTQEIEAHEKALGIELAHQEVVAHEMGHRVKNLMATVTALVSLSARNARSPRDMEESLRGRILALSSVIDLGLKGPRTIATHGALCIEDILRAVLAPFMWTEFEKQRITLTGPPLVVGERASEALALIFHELTTNAIKYGALLQADGHITVDWQQSDGRLKLCWREQSAHFVAEGTNPTGFGTRLVSHLVGAEFSGRVDREVTAQGWVTRISLPMASLGLIEQERAAL